MPVAKDLKRLIRSRMQKTGESYTTARLRLLARSGPAVAEFASLAGIGDDAVRAATGKTWRAWVRALDDLDAAARPHRDIARLLRERHGLSSWWSQTVTVGYERIRGLRDVGQRRDGSYEANKSKTYPVAVGRLYRAFSVKRTRDRWLDEPRLVVRTSRVDKSMRVGWPDGTSVHVYFTAKAAAKSQVAVQHRGLADRQEMMRRKAYWEARLRELAALL